MFRIMSGFLASLAGRFLGSAGSLFPFRKDWTECCRDNDARRKAIESMRDECWSAGL